MSPVVIKLEDFIQVLRYHKVVRVDKDKKEIKVWRGELKMFFPLEDEFITRRFVHRASKKLGIEMHYFFHPEMLYPSNGDDLILQ